MAEVGFEFQADDEPTNRNDVNVALAELAERKRKLMRKLRSVSSEPEKVAAAITAWADCAERCVVLQHDISRAMVQMDATPPSSPLHAELVAQIERQAASLEAAAQAEPKLRAAVAKLLPNDGGE